MVALNIGYWEIRVFGIYRRTPLDAAERAALAGTVLPDHFAAAIGIDRPADAGFLPDHDQVFAAGKCRQHRCVAEIEIVAAFFLEAIRVAFAARKDVLRRHLM